MLRKLILSQSLSSKSLNKLISPILRTTNSPILNFSTFVYSNKYEEAYINSIHPATMEKFWAQQSNKIDWFSTPHVILEQSQKNQLMQRWFVDGKMNMSFNCVDRHLNTLKDSPAIYYESPLAGISQTITYAQLHDKVSKVAGMLKNFGIKKGDVVLIHMPNMPEAVYTMLACARIGAVHSYVFGGFSAAELANRIKDSQPKLILSTNVGYGVNRQIDYKIILDNALKIANMKETKCIIVQRPNTMQSHFERGTNFDYNEEFEKAKKTDCTEVYSIDPLYILYTSGQGASKVPRGVVRDNGGTAVALQWAMNNIFDVGPRQTMFAASDLGWVVGHQFTIYGPLLNGSSTILFEGKPTGTPDAGIYWKLIEKHKARAFFTFPTSVRSIKNVDPEGNLILNYNISSLQSFHLAGERCDIQTYNWIQQHFKNAILNDNYWQTESGWPMISNFSKKLHQFQPKQGSTTKPVPGFNIKIFDDANKEAAPNQLGNIVIKLPLPPSFVLPLNHEDQFKQLYLGTIPGYYFTGDSGYKDGDGYIHIMTKSADVINISGHRLSSISLEQALTQHKDVAEAAVVGLTDEIKGEVPIGFVVLNKDAKISSKIEMQEDLIHLVRAEIGPIAYFQKIIFVKGLPKTKSEKVLRQLLSNIVNGEDFVMPTTLKDPKIVKIIEEKCNKLNLGKSRKLNIQFESASNKAQQ